MNELIEKRKIIETTDEIESRLEKMHCLLCTMQNAARDDEAVLLDILHDYLDQVLEQTEDLKSNLEENFEKDYKKVVSIA